MHLQCLGAAGRVTGSCHLVQAQTALRDLIRRDTGGSVHIARLGECFDLLKPLPFLQLSRRLFAGCLYNARMKIRRYCNLVANIAVSFAASVIFSFAAAQTTDTESSSAAAGKTAEPVAAAPAKPVESNIADAAATESPAVAAGETSDPAADVPASNTVDSPAAGNTAIGAGQAAEPAVGDSVELVSLPEPVQPVRPRYNRDDVLWIQQRLEELGYYTGPVDGAFGRGTREAIKAYQADQELEQDGRPTAALRDFMWRNGG